MPGISDSGIREIFAWGIQNQGKFWSWNPEYSSTEPGILLTIGIRNSSSTDKGGIQYLESETV